MLFSCTGCGYARKQQTPEEPELECACGVSDWRNGDWLQTYSGRPFWPFDPRLEDLDIEDIALPLSRMGRFGDHSLHHYNVADHSIWVMNQLLGQRPGVQLAALLHDAAEAYLRDVARPLKRHPDMSVYRNVERRLLILILEWAGVLDDYREFEHVIQYADQVALATERRDLMAKGRFVWAIESVEPHSAKIYPSTSAETSCNAFKYHYIRLRGSIV